MLNKKFISKFAFMAVCVTSISMLILIRDRYIEIFQVEIFYILFLLILMPTVVYAIISYAKFDLMFPFTLDVVILFVEAHWEKTGNLPETETERLQLMESSLAKGRVQFRQPLKDDTDYNQFLYPALEFGSGKIQNSHS